MTALRTVRNLRDLDDVPAGLPSDGQVPVWDAASGRFVWGAGGGGGGGAPSGPAGGVLGGTYPNPGFAVDMATQAELDTHAALTTSAHGGIVSSADARLTDARTPTAHTHPESDVTNLVTDLAAKVPKSLVDAKGDLLVGTADDTVDRLPRGTDFADELIPDSSASTGLKWGKRRDALRPSGALFENFSRLMVMGNAGVLLSQRLQLVAIDLPTGLVVTSISFFSGTTALATGVNQLFGLYNSSRALLRGSVDDTSTAWAASALKTLALTSTFTTTYSGLHYLGILINATTVPSLRCLAGVLNVNSIAPILTGRSSTGVTALPDPAAAITVDADIPYAFVS